MRPPHVARHLSMLMVISIVLVLTADAQQPALTPLESFQEFWSAFRRAVLTTNKSQVAEMAQFPFVTQGTLDDSPTTRQDRDAFLALWNRLLSQDPGLQPESDTMQQLVMRTPTVTPHHLHEDQHAARVGVFEFRHLNGRWWFTSAYLDD